MNEMLVLERFLTSKLFGQGGLVKSPHPADSNVFSWVISYIGELSTLRGPPSAGACAPFALLGWKVPWRLDPLCG